MRTDLPSGTVTFLFTDIEGSTKLSQQYANELSALLARHKEILNQAIETHNGFVFQIVGDSFSAASILLRTLSRLPWKPKGNYKANLGLLPRSKFEWEFIQGQHT
jgi:class 3 adenylate cyclase